MCRTVSFPGSFHGAARGGWFSPEAFFVDLAYEERFQNVIFTRRRTA